MIHVHDILRKRLLSKIQPDTDKMDIESLRISEWSNEFERLMRNRLVVGAFRYGLIGDKNKKRFDGIGYMLVKIKRYNETGNLEALVDIANLALLEFVEGRHPKKHFSSLDDTNEHAREIVCRKDI